MASDAQPGPTACGLGSWRSAVARELRVVVGGRAGSDCVGGRGGVLIRSRKQCDGRVQVPSSATTPRMWEERAKGEHQCKRLTTNRLTKEAGPRTGPLGRDRRHPVRPLLGRRNPSLRGRLAGQGRQELASEALAMFGQHHHYPASAASGHPGALDLIRHIILASASIPLSTGLPFSSAWRCRAGRPSTSSATPSWIRLRPR